MRARCAAFNFVASSLGLFRCRHFVFVFRGFSSFAAFLLPFVFLLLSLYFCISQSFFKMFAHTQTHKRTHSRKKLNQVFGRLPFRSRSLLNFIFSFLLLVFLFPFFSGSVPSHPHSPTKRRRWEPETSLTATFACAGSSAHTHTRTHTTSRTSSHTYTIFQPRVCVFLLLLYGERARNLGRW